MNISKENLLDAIAQVGHPSINFSLVELGILQDLDVVDNTVTATFVFPFPDIPIADTLIHSVQDPLEAMGYNLKYDTRVMTDEEREKFLALEAKGWKG
jgi:metal-sulfur cluster biosynthetic enzyme